MKFTQINNTILIDNIKLTLDQFRILEPNYPDLPSGYDIRIYESGKEHCIRSDVYDSLPKLNLPLTWTDGERYFNRIDEFKNLYEFYEPEEKEMQEVLNYEIKKREPYAESRKSEYPNTHEMVIALWENLVEKKTKKESGILEIQKKREAIKNKYPKNDKE